MGHFQPLNRREKAPDRYRAAMTAQGQLAVMMRWFVHFNSQPSRLKRPFHRVALGWTRATVKDVSVRHSRSVRRPLT